MMLNAIITPLFIGTTELLLIAALALLLFGGKKLPEMMRGMGKGIKSFKEGMNEPSEAEKKAAEEQQIRAEEERAIHTQADEPKTDEQK